MRGPGAVMMHPSLLAECFSLAWRQTVSTAVLPREPAKCCAIAPAVLPRLNVAPTRPRYSAVDVNPQVGLLSDLWAHGMSPDTSVAQSSSEVAGMEPISDRFEGGSPQYGFRQWKGVAAQECQSRRDGPFLRFPQPHFVPQATELA